MSAARRYCEIEDPARIQTDRLLIAGRRGTGKSTGAKQMIARGHKVIWCARTKGLARSLPSRFVPPAVADVLPEVEDRPSDADMPLFGFGQGVVRVVPLSAVPSIRDTGIDVDGSQAEAIILDEALAPGVRYLRGEPKLLDDLAETIGRSGSIPPIIVIGNPITNACPYAYIWRCNVLAEGVYLCDDRTTEVRGTSECRDCFGRRIGIDAKPPAYAAHLDRGGDVVEVNGRSIRVIEISGRLYVGAASDPDVTLMARGRYTPDALTGPGSKFLARLTDAYLRDLLIFDSFESELTCYELLKAN